MTLKVVDEHKTVKQKKKMSKNNRCNIERITESMKQLAIHFLDHLLISFTNKILDENLFKTNLIKQREVREQCLHSPPLYHLPNKMS